MFLSDREILERRRDLERPSEPASGDLVGLPSGYVLTVEPDGSAVRPVEAADGVENVDFPDPFGPMMP